MAEQLRGHTETTATAAVSVRDISMTYGRTAAVAEISFDLEAGRFLTILGPSGSGKTTLLRMIAGFLDPSAGEIRINGRPVRAMPPHKRSIGMVFQRLALFPHMTAAENVAFPLKMRRFDARTIPERVARYLDLVKLGGLGGRRIHELSGGQQQRVAIARALVFEPDLLLLDEPLAALDRKLREEMQLEFRRIQRELGVTTINVTHDQREALVMSDQILVMDHGRMQQLAPPDVTYHAPANAFVAGFLGVTNFIHGTVLDHSGELVRFRSGALELQGIWAGTTMPRPGDAVRATLRGEHVRVALDPGTFPGAATSIRAQVTDSIFEGERALVEARPVDWDGIIRIIHHDAGAPLALSAGTNVFLAWNPEQVLVFAR